MRPCPAGYGASLRENGISRLTRSDLRRLWSFRTILDFVLNLLASALDGREVREYISATGIRCNKAETLFGVEPFHFTRLNHDLQRPIEVAYDYQERPTRPAAESFAMRPSRCMMNCYH